MAAVMPNRSFDADAQRHCAAKRADERTLAAQCRSAPVNSNVERQHCSSLFKPNTDRSGRGAPIHPCSEQSLARVESMVGSD